MDYADYYNQELERLKSKNAPKEVEVKSEEPKQTRSNADIIKEEALKLNSMPDDVRNEYIKKKGYNENTINDLKKYGYDPETITTWQGFRGATGGVIGGFAKGLGADLDAAEMYADKLGFENVSKGLDFGSNLLKEGGNMMKESIAGDEYNTKLKRGDLAAKGVDLISEGFGQVGSMLIAGGGINAAARGIGAVANSAKLAKGLSFAGNTALGASVSAGDLYSSIKDEDLQKGKSQEQIDKDVNKALTSKEGLASIALGAGGQSLLFSKSNILKGVELGKTLPSTIARNIGIEGTTEGLEEGLQEKAKQDVLTPNKETDWKKIGVAALQGAIGSIGGGSVAGVKNHYSPDNFKASGMPLTEEGAQRRIEYLSKTKPEDDNFGYDIVNNGGGRFQVIEYDKNKKNLENQANLTFKEISNEDTNLDNNGLVKEEVLSKYKEENQELYNELFNINETAKYELNKQKSVENENVLNSIIENNKSNLDEESIVKFKTNFENSFAVNDTLTTDILHDNDINLHVKEKLFEEISNNSNNENIKQIKSFADLERNSKDVADINIKNKEYLSKKENQSVSEGKVNDINTVIEGNKESIKSKELAIKESKFNEKDLLNDKQLNSLIEKKNKTNEDINVINSNIENNLSKIENSKLELENKKLSLDKNEKDYPIKLEKIDNEIKILDKYNKVLDGKKEKVKLSIDNELSKLKSLKQNLTKKQFDLDVNAKNYKQNKLNFENSIKKIDSKVSLLEDNKKLLENTKKEIGKDLENKKSEVVKQEKVLTSDIKQGEVLSKQKTDKEKSVSNIEEKLTKNENAKELKSKINELNNEIKSINENNKLSIKEKAIAIKEVKKAKAETEKALKDFNKSKIKNVNKTEITKNDIENIRKVKETAEAFLKDKGFNIKVFNSMKSLVNGTNFNEDFKKMLLESNQRAMFDLSNGNIALNSERIIKDYNTSFYKQDGKSLEEYVEDIVRHEVIGHAQINKYFKGNFAERNKVFDELLKNNDVLVNLIKEKAASYNNDKYIAIEEVFADMATGHVEVNGKLIPISKYEETLNKKESAIDSFINLFTKLGKKENGIEQLKKQLEIFNKDFNESEYGQFVNEVYKNTTAEQRGTLRFSDSMIDTMRIRRDIESKGLVSNALENVNTYIDYKFKGHTIFDNLKHSNKLKADYSDSKNISNILRGVETYSEQQFNNLDQINKSGLREFNEMQETLPKESLIKVNKLLNKESFDKKELNKSNLNETEMNYYKTVRQIVDTNLQITNKSDVYNSLLESKLLSEKDLSSIKSKHIILEVGATKTTEINEMVEDIKSLLDNSNLDEKQLKDKELINKYMDNQVKSVKDLINENYVPLMRFGKFYLEYYQVNKDGSETKNFEMFDGILKRNKRLKEIQSGIGRNGENVEYNLEKNKLGEIDGKTFSKLEGDPFLANKVIENILESGDFNNTEIEKVLNEVRNETFKKATGHRNRLAKRKNVYGFSYDMERVINDFSHNGASYASRKTELSHAKQGLEELKKEKGNTHGEIDFFTKYLDSVEQPTPKLLSTFKTLNSIYYLGLNISSSVMNFFGGPTVIAPFYSQFGVNYFKTLSFFKDVSITNYNKKNSNGIYYIIEKMANRNKLTEKQKLEANERYDNLVRTGYINNNEFSNPSSGEAFKAIKTDKIDIDNAIAKTLDVAMTPMKYTEIITRQVSALAAIEASFNINENYLKSNGYKNEIEFVKGCMDRTMGNFSKTSTPMAFRGPVMTLLYAFKNYPVTVLTTYIDAILNINNKDSKQIKTLAYMTIAGILLNGTKGIPLGEDMEDLIRTLLRNLGIKDYKFKDLLGDNAFSTLLEKGALNGITNDLTSSIANRASSGNIIPATKVFDKTLTSQERNNQVKELLGPAFGILFNGLTNPSVDTLAPTTVKNFIKAKDIFLEGKVKDAKGNVITEDVNTLSGIGRVLGFTPTAESKEKSKLKDVREIDSLLRYRKDKAYDLIAESVIKKDPELKKEGLQLIKEWNEDYPKYKIQFDSSKVNSRVKKLKETYHEKSSKTLSKEVRKEFDEESEED